MKKDLSYYLGLEYPIHVRPIPKEKGGGYEASIPQLGRYTIVGDGDTIEGALKNLEKTKKEYFKKFFKEGSSIPEPAPDEEDFSGKLLLRIPPYLHMVLTEQANNYGISLNQHINALLAMSSPVKEMKILVEQMCNLWQSTVHYELSNKKSDFSWTYQAGTYRGEKGDIINLPKAS